jgi:hypothetical protein
MKTQQQLLEDASNTASTKQRKHVANRKQLMLDLRKKVTEA